MPTFFDPNGRELGLQISGPLDDICIDDIWYEDNPNEEVSEDVVDYIYEYYATELDELWWETRRR